MAERVGLPDKGTVFENDSLQGGVTAPEPELSPTSLVDPLSKTRADSAPMDQPSDLATLGESHCLPSLATSRVTTPFMITGYSTGGGPPVPHPEEDVSADLRNTGVEAVTGALLVEPLDKSDEDAPEESPSAAVEACVSSELDGTSSPAPLARVQARIPLQDSPCWRQSPRNISPEIASLKCKDLGVEGVLRRFNQVLAGDSGQEILMSDPGVEPLLERLVNGEDLDFGTLYARVRHLWDSEVHRYYLRDVDMLYSELIEFSNRLYAAKSACVTGHFIDRSTGDLDQGVITWFPRKRCVISWARRLWDLRAHRVIPYHFSLSLSPDQFDRTIFLPPHYHAVSHSWTDIMLAGSSIVNGHEWPVPLPTGVTLEAVRNELLNLGAEYAWLDVVCLRQHSDSDASEFDRVQEWAVDIPTIGAIYEKAEQVVRYYNGLGVPFECRGWSGPRHWLCRVWTIQEIRDGSIPAGLPEGLEAGDLMKQKSVEDGMTLEYYLRPVMDLERNLSKLEAGLIGLPAVMKLATELKKRFATNPIDKIAAFGALLRTSHIPLYKGDMDPEDAWDLLVQQMPHKILQGFLWLVCASGKGKFKWKPSWDQLMCGDFDTLQAEYWTRCNLEILNNNFICQPDCRLLTGHAQLTWKYSDMYWRRQIGEVQYSDSVVHELKFYVTACLGQECRDSTVRLVGSDLDGWYFRYLMVCKEVKHSEGKIGYEKISVVYVMDSAIQKAEYQEVDAIFV
ncbi:hypothetical protein NEOLEDRAFT_1241558 [Neolentinus lepideus HHB14362 ss-1]|uniref:Heterokaryon incompatibility domain-containing protein n=1 Tax=Neolentinus lepideus HHB14362 ss-1 TaxID=1314782 RepID=A0A165SU42_9AGAM|nr:hypothetical protein NEOLEDRAFT_1241558 [Neolentinus lepideus HHB14362 ss-1]